ncbi:hypothetical protein [Hyphomonas sp. UBA4494]|jgi:Flp pilus assembly pilin Flp|uniref:hypothetical protein n=1 Tax=Hyphomonas sp. UBA4494 TaxID=1946631 RepID=UPI0025BACC52|nr:hypothetical protein [Hyphomonas sp. UBA4494]
MSKKTKFLKSEDGLVAIEWVSIAAVAFIAAIAISGALLGGASDLGGAVAGQMSATAEEINGEEGN